MGRDGFSRRLRDAYGQLRVSRQVPSAGACAQRQVWMPTILTRPLNGPMLHSISVWRGAIRKPRLSLPAHQSSRAFRVAPSRRSMRRSSQEPLREGAQMNAGDAERARTVLPHSDMEGYVDSSILNSYYGLRGEVRCASGQYVSGLFDLSTSIHALVASTGLANVPWLARTRAVAGLCALAHGKRTMAAELQMRRGRRSPRNPT